MNTYTDKLLKQVQKVDLEAAEFFVSFCEKHDLLCYFCGGGCIGAVRHHGFIPWDDDLDFFLPREDYEKLKKVWKDTERYTLCYPTETYNDHCMYITLRDKHTTMIKPYQKDMDIVHGISVDIFPLDGYPDSRIKRGIQIFWGLVFQLYCAQMIPENHGKLIELFGKAGLKIIKDKNLRYRIWRYAEKQMSKNKISDCNSITEICAGPGYMKNRYPKECFETSIYLDFEDTKMPVPIGYDTYLRIAFGDYMKYPPKEKQIPSHDAVLIKADEPYLKYKNIYYCKTGKNN